MIKARISLQSILLAFYLMLIVGMIQNLVFNFVWLQKNEILPVSICLGVFIICFISGIFNVFYYKKVSKILYWTFMFYLFLPFSIPLIILEMKYKDKLNNESYFKQIKQSSFTRRFLIITTILQIVELVLMLGAVISFIDSNFQDLKIIAWVLLILIVLVLFGLIASWVYFLTNKKVFKIMMIFNLLFGWPLFFLNFIMKNNNQENGNNFKLKNLQN